MLCADFAPLCWGLLAHHGWLLLSRLGPLKVLEIVECPPSRIQKSGKGCEIKFQISALPVHTRGLLGRKQTLWPLCVWLVLILLQKGQSDPVWSNYFPRPVLSLQSSGKRCQHQKCSFLPAPSLPRYPLRKIPYGPQNLDPVHLINNKRIKNKTKKPSSPVYEDYLAGKAKHSSTGEPHGPGPWDTAVNND